MDTNFEGFNPDYFNEIQSNGLGDNSDLANESTTKSIGSIFNINDNPGGYLPKVNISGMTSKFLKDVLEVVNQHMSERINTLNPEVIRAFKQRGSFKVITIDSTPDSEGNYIQNPTMVIAAKIIDNDKEHVVYTPIIFSHLGRSTETVASICDKIAQQEKALMFNNKLTIDTYDKIVDGVFLSVVTKDLVKALDIKDPVRANFVNLEPVIMSDRLHQATIEEIGIRVSEIGLNKVLTYCIVNIFKLMTDINLSKDLKPSQNTNIKLSIKNIGAFPTEGSTNQIGEAVRKDFQVVLYGSTKTSNISPNKIDNSIVISETFGYIESIPQLTQSEIDRNKSVVRFIPNIIITETSTMYSTTSYKLLSILSAYVMASKQYLLGPILQNITLPNGKESPVSPGALNVLHDHLGDFEKTGKPATPIKLSDPKIKQEAVINYIREAYLLDNPIISIDVPPYNIESYVDAGFITAGTAPDHNIRMAAAKEIIDAAHTLTNGIFPKNYNPDNIFKSAINIPLGYYEQSNSVARDIRCVDMAFVISESKGDPSMINKWYNSYFNIGDNGKNPFFNKLEVLNALGLRDAKITSIGTRLTFNAMFITELYRAAKDAGFFPSVDVPGITLTEQQQFNYDFSGSIIHDPHHYQYKDFVTRSATPYFANMNNNIDYSNRFR